MTRQGITAPLAALTVVGGTIAAPCPPALAQDGRERVGGDRVQPPTELLREYPFRQGQLHSRERSRPGPAQAKRRGGAAPASVGDSSPASGSAALVIALAVLAATALLLALSPVRRRVARAAAGANRSQAGQPEAGQADEPRPDAPEPPQAPPPERQSGEPSVRPSRFRRLQPLDGPVGNGYAVVNQKGGVGKTTSLARTTRSSGRPTRKEGAGRGPRPAGVRHNGARRRRRRPLDRCRHHAGTSCMLTGRHDPRHGVMSVSGSGRPVAGEGGHQSRDP